MESASIGTLLSVVSLVCVGILYLKVDDLSDQVRPLTKGRAERHAVNDLPDDPIERDAPARAVSDELPGEAGGPSPADLEFLRIGRPKNTPARDRSGGVCRSTRQARRESSLQGSIRRSPEGAGYGSSDPGVVA